MFLYQQKQLICFLLYVCRNHGRNSIQSLLDSIRSLLCYCNGIMISIAQTYCVPVSATVGRNNLEKHSKWAKRVRFMNLGTLAMPPSAFSSKFRLYVVLLNQLYCIHHDGSNIIWEMLCVQPFDECLAADDVQILPDYRIKKVINLQSECWFCLM